MLTRAHRPVFTSKLTALTLDILSPSHHSSTALEYLWESVPLELAASLKSFYTSAGSTMQTQGESRSTSPSSYSLFSRPSRILQYGLESQNLSSLQASSTSTRPPDSPPSGQQSSVSQSGGQHDMPKRLLWVILIAIEGRFEWRPIEVDVKGASRAANEKRKRNAAASARCRTLRQMCRA